jgi:4-hydroxybenzoate polyprenyltransferase
MAIRAYLTIMRPANLLTAVADIWAGAALSGYLSPETAGGPPGRALLIGSLSSACLYAGGVVFNDICDASLDRIERPERPIPSGKIALASATVWGLILLIAGIALAWALGPVAGCIAIGIALAAVVYDRWGKHRDLLGPLNMGVCRGLNLCLGMSLIPAQMGPVAWTVFVPVIYIYAITLISRGEVHGGTRGSLRVGLGLYVAVILGVAAMAIIRHQFLLPAAFLLLFALCVFPPLASALKQPSGPKIGRAVKAGVIGLILLDAAWVATSGNLYWALVTALLLPVSVWVARYFAVT